MDKTRLYIKGVTQLRQFGNIGLIVLTDADQTKHLSMPCNMDRLYDLEGFFKKRHTSVDALISVLWTIIRDHTGTPYEVHVTDVSRGKYRMELQDVDKSIAYKVEPTAAITCLCHSMCLVTSCWRMHFVGQSRTKITGWRWPSNKRWITEKNKKL